MTRPGALAGVLLVLASGCATQSEEGTRSELASERDEPGAEAESTLLEASPPTDKEAAPRSLEQLQRELAANNAKLRELGVLPPVPIADAEQGARESKPGRPAAPTKRNQPKPKGEVGAAVDDAASPEQVKAAPPPASNGLDPQARCQMICELAAISCGLGDEICELADRHAEAAEYVSACERANADCEAAKEACDACAE